MIWYVYILECNDGSLYTGCTNKLKDRFERHSKGKGSKYTRARRPLKLLYAEEFKNRSEAMKRELEIKSFGVDNKKQLIQRGAGRKFPSAQDI
jgi:putative endonuclease